MAEAEFPVGSYRGNLESAVLALTKGGSEQVVIKFVLSDIQGNPLGVTRSMYLSMSGGAWPYTRQKLEALGFNGDFDNPQFDPQKSSNFEVLCKHDEYEGKTTEKWDLANWGGGPEKASNDVIKRYNAKWKAEVGSPPPKPAGAPARPPSLPPRPPAKQPERVSPKDQGEAFALFKTIEGDDAEKFWALIAKIEKKHGIPVDDFEQKHWDEFHEELLPF